MVDTAAGEVIQVNVSTGEKTVIANVDSSIDNLAINSKDQIYMTNMAKNGVYFTEAMAGTISRINITYYTRFRPNDNILRFEALTLVLGVRPRTTRVRIW